MFAVAGYHAVVCDAFILLVLEKMISFIYFLIHVIWFICSTSRRHDVYMLDTFKEGNFIST